jgi:hypothetical protein
LAGFANLESSSAAWQSIQELESAAAAPSAPIKIRSVASAVFIAIRVE